MQAHVSVIGLTRHGRTGEAQGLKVRRTTHSTCHGAPASRRPQVACVEDDRNGARKRERKRERERRDRELGWVRQAASDHKQGGMGWGDRDTALLYAFTILFLHFPQPLQPPLPVSPPEMSAKVGLPVVAGGALDVKRSFTWLATASNADLTLMSCLAEASKKFSMPNSAANFSPSSRDTARSDSSTSHLFPMRTLLMLFSAWFWIWPTQFWMFSKLPRSVTS
mmetsp:Transcript_17892/g.51293  ORF Transcript_17892/g.51293 Transcript_17892/m.51293 type:complete len:223 (-) Transcript_17892:655-1323(-)